MRPKPYSLKWIGVFSGLSALLFVQAAPLDAQPIPPEHLPAPGTDTGLEGKYDPTNGIAQLIRDKSPEAARSKIFEDEHVLVFMPLPDEEGGRAGSCSGGSETERAKYIGSQAG